MGYGIGIDIGGGKIRTVTLSPEGQILGREIEQIGEDDPAYDWTERIDSEIARVAVGHGEPPVAIGLAAPVLVAADGHRVTYLKDNLGLPRATGRLLDLGMGRPVSLINGTHAELLGEASCGAAHGIKNVLLVHLGSEVSGAAMVDGRLLRGHLGRCAQIGHVTVDPLGPPDSVGTPGSLEDALGDSTIRERSNGRYESMEALIAAYQSGLTTDAASILHRSLRALGGALAGLINVLDPELILLSGPTSYAGGDFLQTLSDCLEPYEWCPGGDRVSLQVAVLGEWSAACGAAHYALTRTPTA